MLVGRHSELERLTSLLRDDVPVVLTGEPGVGKTSLLLAALERSGRPYRLGGALGSLSWMAYLPLSRAIGERRLHGDPAAVAQRVRRAVRDDEVLALEDLHWADEGTLAVIELLARSTSLVASLRPAEPGLEALADRLEAAGFARMDVEPLADESAEALVRAIAPEASQLSIARIVRRSGGVPLLLTVLAGPGGEESESLRIALAARLRALSARAADAFMVLAAIGRPVDSGAFDETVVVELERARLIARTEDVVAIGHAVLGELALARLDGAGRARTHRRAADLVTDAGELARHLEAAGEPGRAREHAMRAATASGGAEAAGHLAVAARCSSGPDGDALRLRAAQELILALRHEEALVLLDAIEGTEAVTRGECAILRSRALWYLGDDDGFRAAIGEAMSHGTSVGGALRAKALVELARVPIFLDPTHEPDGVTIARDGLAAATEANLPLARAEMLLGLAHYMRDEPGWRPALEGALHRAREEGDVDTELATANNLVTAHESSGDPAVARRLALDMIASTGARGMVGWQLQFRAMLLNLDLHGADYGQVVAEAVELLDEPLDARARAQVLTALIFSLVELGRFEIADDRLAALAADASAPVSADVVRWLQAEAALLGGRPADARRLALQAIDLGMSDPFAALVERWAARELGDRPVPLDEVAVPMFLGVRAESLGIEALAAGMPADAVAHFDLAADRWLPYHRRGALRCRWAAAESLRQTGDGAAARARLLDLEDELAGRGMAPMVARAHRSLRALGERRSAPRSRRAADGLTEREAQVVRLLASGLSNAEIGRRLSLSRSTITELIASARDRMGATSRGHAAALSIR